MSTGSVAEKPKAHDFEQAHQWCVKMRKILGKGKMGDAKKLKNKEAEVYNKVKSLHQQFPQGLSGNALKLEEKYNTLAFECMKLEESYLSYQRQIDELTEIANNEQKKRNWEETIFRKTNRVTDIKHEIALLEKLRDGEREKIRDSIGDFDKISKSMSVEIENRKDQESIHDKLLKNSNKKDGADVKQIKAEIQKWKDALTRVRSLLKVFPSCCDSSMVKIANEKFNQAITVNGSLVDPLKIVTLADVTTYLTPMFGLETFLSSQQKLYNQARNRFEKALEPTRKLMIDVQKECEGSTVSQLLETFTDGESASLRNEWIKADQLINEKFREKLTLALQVGTNGKVAWLKCVDKINEYKRELDILADPGFNITVLTPLGEAFQVADNRDYIAAYQLFTKSEPKAREALEVAKSVKGQEITIRNEVNSLVKLIGNIQDSNAKQLATVHLQTLNGIAGEFWGKRHVATRDELSNLVKIYTDKLKVIRGEIEQFSLSDSDDKAKKANDEQHKKMCDGSNRKTTIASISTIVEKAEKAILEYAAVMNSSSPTAPNEPLATWRKDLSEAKTFLANLKNEKWVADPTAIETEFKRLSMVLEKVSEDASQLIAEEMQAISKIRIEIVKKLDWFDSNIGLTRLDSIFREATWRKEAKVEAIELRALSTVDNLEVLTDVLKRATKLETRCSKVRDAIPKKLLDRIIGPDEFDGLKDPNDPSGVHDGNLFQETTAKDDYDELKGRLNSIRSFLKKGEHRIYVPREVEKVSSAVALADSELRSEGYIGIMDAATKTNMTKNVEDIESKLNELKDLFVKVKARRDNLQQKLVDFRAKISTDLIPEVEKQMLAEAQKKNLPKPKSISGEFLPIMKEATALGLRLINENLNEFDVIESELAMLQDELQLLLIKAGTENAFTDEIKAIQEGEADRDQSIEAKCKAKMEYETTLEEFKKHWELVKKLDGIDQQELDTVRSVREDAFTAAAKPLEDWAKAAKDIKLALLLTKRLESDPLASQTTDRGREHLKELTPRWSKGISRLRDTVTELGNAISKSAAEDEGADASKIAGLFEKKVVPHFSEKVLNKAAFASELLVLQRKGIGDSKALAADRKEKKKAREKALVKVRTVKNIVEKNPAFQNLLYKKNPWSNAGGAVDGLPMLRALNDLELNIERGIYS